MENEGRLDDEEEGYEEKHEGEEKAPEVAEHVDEAPLQEHAEEAGEGDDHGPYLHPCPPVSGAGPTGKGRKDKAGGEQEQMAGTFLPYESAEKNEDEGDEHIAHDAEDLDEEVGSIGTGPSAKVPDACRKPRC